jgi:Asp-tRNA(Asn)/Glu-tRNA(Gln) amidotransferase A subunit family amidase
MAVRQVRYNELPITEAAALISRGALSAEQLCLAVLERIWEVEPKIHGYVTVTGEQALAAARQADREIEQGRYRGPLHGIPIALKDVFDTRGIPTQSGSRVRQDYVPRENAEPVRRLLEAGAVVVGKTVTHEFAFGVTSAPARCAWDVNCVPGGSSGGSGTAVAADACLAALGTDTGCSVRNPASLNGVCGLKPTFGRVSKRGVTPVSWSCDHVGPLAKSVEDCGIVLAAIAGYDPLDRTTADVAVDDYLGDLRRGLKGLRIGVPRNYFFDSIKPDVEAVVREAIALLAREGGELVEVTVPAVEYSLPVIHLLGTVEAADVHRSDLREHGELYGDGLRATLEAGSLVSPGAYMNAQNGRAAIKRGLRSTFESAHLDVLVTPTCPLGPIAYGEEFATIADEAPAPLIDHYARYASPFNLSGQPALTVPCGFDSEGHPVGLQIAGRPFDEATVLRVGHAYESATPWHAMRAPL